MKRSHADVLIIGAGAIGCSIARELAARGLDVTVVERDTPGRSATWAAAGMLSPLGEALAAAGPFLELADAGLRRYGPFAEALRAETGIDIQYDTAGKLQLSVGDMDDEIRDVATSPLATRFEAREVTGEEARGIEPALSDRITRALFIGRDHSVNNRLLAQALVASATAAGVEFRIANGAARLITRDNVVEAVELTSGERISAPRVVLAAGAWSGDIEGLPRSLPMRPVKGQMFAIDAGSRPLLTHMIMARSCYMIPRENGRLWVGATVEDVGYSRGPTPRGISTLVSAAIALVPEIADAPLVETWAGFRPALPDHLPVLGADPDLDGLFYATGHYRNGILLAPITGEIMAALLVDGSSPVPLEAFSVARFDN